MKSPQTLLLATFCCVFLFACKKENTGMSSIPETYTGKYLETKLRIYSTFGPAISGDTTYSSSEFNANDYISFNNGQATVSGDYTYDPTSLTPRLSKSTVALENYNYVPQNSYYVLTDSHGAGSFADTLRVYNSNTLVLHSAYMYLGPTPNLYPVDAVVDAYYTQQ